MEAAQTQPLEPPALQDRQQRLRLMRHLMAVATSIVIVGFVYLYVGFGFLPLEAAHRFAAMVLALAAGFGGCFLSGINRRFPDPSLTAPQMLGAGAALAVLAHGGPEVRALLLPIYMIVLLFGAFRLSTGGLLAVGGFFLATYALAVSLAWPGGAARRDTAREWLQMLQLAALIGWFAWIGGYINRMRRQLRHVNTDLKQALQRIEKVASFDELTGLYNRRMIRELLEREKKRCDRNGRSMCIALVDIDHFKTINDRFGHALGDQALKSVASMLQRGLRETDVIGRYGGEEFLIVIADCEHARAGMPLERTRQAVASAGLPGLPQDHRITVSIGACTYRCGEEADSAIGRADAALYEAKRSGRNRVIWKA